MIHPVILCGGSGTRLWPTSRRAYPKQFAPLMGAESLYQTTLRRFSGPDFAAPLVMTGDEFRFLATEQAAAIGLADARVVVEPAARDTAPAILTAALMLQDDPDALMLVAPSDHVIADVPAFLEAVAQGAGAARDGALVTFGVVPSAPRPATAISSSRARPGRGRSRWRASARSPTRRARPRWWRRAPSCGTRGCSFSARAR